MKGLVFAFILLPFALFQRPDSVQIFVEEHNTIIRVSANDYSSALGKLADKTQYAQTLNSLLDAEQGSVLYVRNGFLTTVQPYDKNDLIQIDAALYWLFQEKKLKVWHAGKEVTTDSLHTEPRDFYVCDKKKGEPAGKKMWIRSSKGDLMFTVTLSLTEAYLKKEWCE